MTSRQLVLDTLNYKNKGRVPRQMWTLPWAEMTYPVEFQKIKKRFPNDICEFVPKCRQTSPCLQGDAYQIGTYTDDWGCEFVNIHPGIIGEVKSPIVIDEEWEDWEKIHIPYEWLSFDIEESNAFIAKNLKDKFVLAWRFPRPFEQLQFIRGTANLYVDLMLRPAKMFDFIEKMHVFYCELLEKIAQTDVDALMIMDDWGSQNSLLISPAIWREIFAPMYRDYIEIAHRHGKKAFMHSDGYILDILPDLAAMGLDAINCQIFCMGLDKLAAFRNKITFWGEIDRQHILPSYSTDGVRAAVDDVKEMLWRDGGCIAQCEFGPGAKPENVMAVFEEWSAI